MHEGVLRLDYYKLKAAITEIKQEGNNFRVKLLACNENALLIPEKSEQINLLYKMNEEEITPVALIPSKEYEIDECFFNIIQSIFTQQLQAVFQIELDSWNGDDNMVCRIKGIEMGGE